MSEPEELILEGAHFATRVARDVWRRYAPPSSSPSVALAAVRGRLEAFVTALFGTPIVIAPMEAPAPLTWLARLARTPRPLSHPAAAGTDGTRVYLPPQIELSVSEDDALALYRLLAVQQSARLVRQTAQAYARIENAGAREWFLLAEAVAVDGWIARNVPGLVAVLESARYEALRTRAPIRAKTSSSTLDDLIRQVLARSVRTPARLAPRTIAFDAPGGPDDDVWAVQASCTWATDAAAGAGTSRYTPLPPVWYWGTILPPSSPVRVSSLSGEQAAPDSPDRRARTVEMRRKPRPREAKEGEDDPSPGTWVIRADDPQESVEDPFGLQRPADREEQADPEGLADSLSDLPEARVVRTPERPREVLRAGDEIQRTTIAASGPGAPVRGIAYPEWDYRIGCYRMRGAIVRESAAPSGSDAWVSAALTRHARLVRRVRARFERLRPRPLRLDRQIDGPEIDLGAYIVAAGDRKGGATVDGRLYAATRPARRELSVALLVDTSASTDAWVSSDRRVVDVEKEALLVVCQALDALGDSYGVYAFSGESAEDVAVLPLKRFDEPNGASVQRRIAALDSDRYTRLGAPIRHLTAALCQQRTARRLLLVLSDGKPNDVDLYEGPYGVEDTKQAVAEARQQGVTVFCLTVDREAPRYARRIFRSNGFAVLRRPEELPAVLIEVLRHLIRA